MNVPPVGLDDTELIGPLRHSWGLDVDGLRYVPKGFGSYHWLASTRQGDRYFLTVDDLDSKAWLGTDRESAFAGLDAAFDIAVELHERAGLDFVVAPIRTREGRTVHRITSRYSLAAFPYIDGRSGRWGDRLGVADGKRLARLLADLHLSTPLLASRTCPRAEALPGRADLEAALSEPERPWAGGPFSEPARGALAAAAETVSEWLAMFDGLASEVAESGGEQVITHGEPHPGNFMRAHGRLVLIDWDTVGLAAPERDLWMLYDGTAEAVSWYTDATGGAVREAGISLYRLAWTLKDLAAYTVVLRAKHGRTEDTEKVWRSFAECLRRLEGRGSQGPSWSAP
jgi:spectinomycin phosphotransferase